MQRWRLTKVICPILLAALGAAAQAAPEAPAEITRLKPLYPQTVLAKEGKPAAAILLPDGPELAPAAGRLREAVRAACGADLPIRRASEVVDAEWQLHLDRLGAGVSTLIALGNVNDNRLLAVLYGERYVVADSLYPGKGGYVVRTVHDPFANGVNVLALCGSDREGVERAVGAFIEKHLKAAGRSVILPEPVVDVRFEKAEERFFPAPVDSLGSKRQPQYSGLDWFQREWRKAGFMDDAGNVIENPDKGLSLLAVTGLLARMGQTWFRTGNRDLLPLMKALVEKNRRLLRNPAKPEEMQARSAEHVHEWDLLEELPIWSDADRLEISNALLRDAALGHERRAFHEQVRQGAVQCLDENHGTFSAMRSYDAWRYFDKYYRIPESRYWMACADAVFSGQSSTFQILEDAAAYLCYCPTTSMEYALKRRDLTYFRRGIAREHARFIALACVNNLGLSTGFGDASSLVCPEFFEALAPAAWFYRDPDLYWVARNALPRECGLRVWQNSIAVDLTVEPREPKEWTGLIRFPLYEAPLAKGDLAKTPVFGEKRDVDPKRFNKLVFKESWSPEGQYLLLDGAGDWSGPGPHGHKHDDINTIPNFTALGRMWLVDHTYQMRAFQDHSGVFTLCNGQGGYLKGALAELKHLAQTPEWGLTQSTFNRWERSLFWRKGRFFLVVDRTYAEKEGEYFARCSFRALGAPELKGKTLLLSQEGRFCKIASDGGAAVDVEPYQFTADEWKSSYPFAEPVARIFQQDKRRVLKPGESIGFTNLLYAYPAKEQEEAVTLQPVSETCALVRDRGVPLLMGAGALPGGLGDADLFVLGDGFLFAAGARALPGDLLRAGAPSTLALDARRGEVRVETDAEVSVTLLGSPRGVTENGKALVLQAGAVTLGPGAHVLKIAGWDGFERAGKVIEQVVAAAEKATAARPPAGTAGAAAPESAGLAVRAIPLGSPVRALLAADLDGAAGDEWLAGTDGGVVACKPDGSVLWRFATKQPVRALDVGDVDGDGKPEVVAGCDDAHVHLLDHAGAERWRFACKPSNDSISGEPVVDFVRIADLEGDGKREIVAGANWVHVLDAAGKPRWEKYMALRRGQICGDFVCGDVADLDGDGKQEIAALFRTSYPLLQIFDAAGNLVVPPGVARDGFDGLNTDMPLAAAALDLFGGGKTRQIVYAGASRLGFLWADQKPREEAGGSVGGAMVAMSHFQSDPNLPPTLLAGTTMCGVMAVQPAPRRSDRWINASVRWHRSLDEKVTALLAADTDGDGKGEAWAGTKGGGVVLFDLAAGETLGTAATPGGAVTCLAPTAGALLAGRADGTVLQVRRGR